MNQILHIIGDLIDASPAFLFILMFIAVSTGIICGIRYFFKKLFS